MCVHLRGLSGGCLLLVLVLLLSKSWTKKKNNSWKLFQLGSDHPKTGFTLWLEEIINTLDSFTESLKSYFRDTVDPVNWQS